MYSCGAIPRRNQPNREMKTIYPGTRFYKPTCNQTVEYAGFGPPEFQGITRPPKFGPQINCARQVDF